MYTDIFGQYPEGKNRTLPFCLCNRRNSYTR